MAGVWSPASPIGEPLRAEGRTGPDVPAVDAPSTLITSVQRALRLLEAVAASDGEAPAKQLARAVGLPIGTTYHLLRTLAFEGYLQRLADGSYVLGDGIARLLEPGDLQQVRQRIRPVLVALRDEARAPAYFARYEDGEVVVKDIQDSPRYPRIDLWVGFREAAHATALGRCVLAFLEPEEVDAYLAGHPLIELTSRTITRLSIFQRSLEQVRADRLAVEDGEYLLGTACLAAPVLAPGLTGAVAISFPRKRLPEADTLAGMVKGIADRISRAYASG
jgi:IclR family transcriptional regulator, acetate operon repressor